MHGPSLEHATFVMHAALCTHRLRGGRSGDRGRLLGGCELAPAWTLRNPRMTSTLVGASSIDQLEQNLGALQQPDFTAAELEEIDRCATDSDLNIWAASSEH